MEGQPSECALFTWGANSYAQLGLTHAEDQTQPRRAHCPLPAGLIRVLTGGGGHTAAVTESRDLLVCGQNHRGQLGLGHTSQVTTFHLCPLAGGRRVQQVSCGWDFTLILTGSGEVLSCGSNAFGQLGVATGPSHSAEALHVKGLKEAAVSVAAGLRHALAATASGRVYQWGTGMLSLAKKHLSPQAVPAHLMSAEPSLVPGFDHVTSQKVAAGSAHCVSLTDTGDVFLWGCNKHGQLVSHSPFRASPSAVDRSLLGREGVRDVHSGWTHLIARTESGRVFTWGRADYAQLGHASLTNHPPAGESGVVGGRPGPVEVESLFGATQVACGSEHSLAVVGGQIFSWGWNEHGMCGDGSHRDVTQPQPIPALAGHAPLLIGCGAGHSMALCSLKDSGV